MKCSNNDGIAMAIDEVFEKTNGSRFSWAKRYRMTSPLAKKQGQNVTFPGFFLFSSAVLVDFD